MKMNWTFGRDAVAAAVPVQPLRLTYKDPTLDTKKTVFHRDEARSKVSCRTSKINLEDFVERDNVTIQPTFEELSMELKINERAENTRGENEECYRRALENVKRALPNLRTLRLSGQHYYYPEQGSADKLRSELQLVCDSIQQITATMQNLRLRSEEPLRYDLYLVFDRKQLNTQTFSRHLNDTFGRSVRFSHLPARETKSQSIRFHSHGISCQIGFQFFTELHMLDDIQGFLKHDRMGGSEALGRMLALTLEMKLSNDH